MSTTNEEVLFYAPAMSSTSQEYDDEAEEETECVTATSIENGRFLFHLNLPEGLSLHSVGIVNGKPELRFGASPKTPSITEEEFAVALRLASEGERPEFFYIPILPGHPFYGRQFKQYKPQWLRGTTFGETFAEADWKMKCLHIGAKSDESKSEFCAWQKDSGLTGLATRFDFRNDKSHGSIIMSCRSVKVQKSDDELVFKGEPKIRINDESNMRYSKYISRILPAVAYYDEPLFLKLRELFKLVLAAEWLVEKGVKVDEEWMMRRSRPTVQSNQQQLALKAIEEGETGCSLEETGMVPGPPSEMIPKVVGFTPPNSNVAVNTKEAELNRSVTQQGVRRRYGWYDRGLNEGVMFDQDGTLYAQKRSMKMVIKNSTSVNGKLTEDESMRLHLALALNIPLPQMSDFGQFLAQLMPSQNAHQEITNALGQISADINHKMSVSESGVQFNTTRVFKPSGSLASPCIEETTTVKISVDDFDMLYSDLDPNQPIWPEIQGKREAVIPNVTSWSELYNETVPWPHTWQSPYIGVGEPVASGGVSSRGISVREEAVKPKAVKDRVFEEEGVYRGYGTQIGVMAKRLRTHIKGAIRLLNSCWEEFKRISQKFTTSWDGRKGPCPSIAFIFAVKNDTWETEWTAYGRTVQEAGVEPYFHGTMLACDITQSRQLCNKGECGICGIASDGLNFNCISKESFQRFGKGFYLAPNSSKCHDYTRTTNGYVYKAMLLCDVHPGRKYHLQNNRQHLRGPPQGFDSVYGQVGEQLNYPEIVVYNAAAVMPRYIIVYNG